MWTWNALNRTDHMNLFRDIHILQVKQHYLSELSAAVLSTNQFDQLLLNKQQKSHRKKSYCCDLVDFLLHPPTFLLRLSGLFASPTNFLIGTRVDGIDFFTELILSNHLSSMHFTNEDFSIHDFHCNSFLWHYLRHTMFVFA